MRYHVRDAHGQELVCPSLADLCVLYNQGFLEDDDLVRPESAQRWVRAGSFPALRGTRERRRDAKTVALLAAAALALAAGFAVLLRLRH